MHNGEPAEDGAARGADNGYFGGRDGVVEPGQTRAAGVLEGGVGRLDGDGDAPAMP